MSNVLVTQTLCLQAGLVQHVPCVSQHNALLVEQIFGVGAQALQFATTLT
jgi:hypothetical protein